MGDPPLTCRLCKDGEEAATEDVEMPGVSALLQYQNVVRSGACYDGDRLEHCALESTECTTDGWTFKSTMEMRKLGHVPCDANHFTGGFCTSSLDKVGCVNVAEACIFPDRFEPRDTCTLHQDLDSSNTNPTWFGACQPMA